MQPKIPLPTDNIYKFYAFLGLMILLTTAIMFFIRHEHYNSMAFERYIPMETLKAKSILNEDEKLKLFLYEKKSEIAKSNKDLELGVYLFYFFFLGGGFTFYGFYHWHTRIQPKQDKLLDLQIQKSENDVKAFNKQLHRTRYSRR
ncbi:hypothetical protein [Pseudoalteromonas piscicida]|uniref:hypothetical protein n=1 Tax=Pseudoalteromonas piscicida TaxID=43662 RepID=UPI0030B3DAD4